MKFDRFMTEASITPPAVVIGVFNPTGLGAVRNLARHGIPVLALDTDRWSPGLRSRYGAHATCPDPHHDAQGFVETLVEIGRRLPQKAVLFPCQDDCVTVVARHADSLSRWYLLPFAGWDTMRFLADKREQITAAWRAGVGTPKTAFLHSPDDAAAAAREIPFPAVMKSVEPLAMRRRHLGKAVRVESAADLPAAYARVRACGPVMLQEVIPGGDDQLFTLFSYVDAQSRPLGLFTCHKLRQHPRLFGECRFGESVWVPEVADSGLAYLREVGFHGVSGIEFKRDPRDGHLKFMEINARHGLRHTLAAAVGVNLTLIAYHDALGRPTEAPRQEEGPRWIYAAFDVPDSLREIARGEMTAREWLTSLRGTRLDGMLAADDPVPGVYQLGRSAGRALRRLATRAAKPRDDTWG
jgi:D-aspartate ligase